jgi:hypothetical protein
LIQPSNLNYLRTPEKVEIPQKEVDKSHEDGKEKRSELVAFLIMMKNSFFLAW